MEGVHIQVSGNKLPENRIAQLKLELSGLAGEIENNPEFGTFIHVARVLSRLLGDLPYCIYYDLIDKAATLTQKVMMGREETDNLVNLLRLKYPNVS